MNIYLLSDNQKTQLLISIAKKAMSYMMESSYYNFIKKAIDDCEKWIKSHEYCGEYFYEILDNEENGFTILQYEDENPKREELWNCIINTIAYVSRKAYEQEEIRYFPESILLVDDKIIENSIECLINYNDEERKFIDRIYQDYVTRQDI